MLQGSSQVGRVVKGGILGLTLGTLLMMGANPVHALPVSYSAMAPQTVDGQLFNFTLNPIEMSDGGMGKLTIKARGDYSLTANSERLFWNLDGLMSGDVKATPSNVITVFSVSDVLFEQSYDISGSVLSSITSDLIANIMVDLATSVNEFNSLDPYVKVTLSYNSKAVTPVVIPPTNGNPGPNTDPTPTPEPSTVLLLGSGLVGILAWGTKMRK